MGGGTGTTSPGILAAVQSFLNPLSDQVAAYGGRRGAGFGAGESKTVGVARAAGQVGRSSDKSMRRGDVRMESSAAQGSGDSTRALAWWVH